MPLVLRRAQEYRPGDWNPDHWNPDDFDVLYDGRTVGRIYRINAATGIWWWESFMPTRRKGYGDAPTRDDAMAAFRAEYDRWRAEQPKA